MKYITALVLAILLTGLSTLASADTGSGVSIPLTVTVTGGSSGSGGGYYGGGYPYTEQQKEILETEDTQYGSSYIPPQRSYIPIPETIKTPTSVPNTPGPAIVGTKEESNTTVLIISILVILLTLVVWWYWSRKQQRTY